MHHKRIVIKDDAQHPSIETQPLEHGAEGNFRSLHILAQMVREDAADVDVREFAEKVVSNVPGHQYHREIVACFEYARDRIIYRQDPKGVERLANTRATLRSGAGDCGDKSELLAAFLAALGHTPRFVVLSYDGKSFQHVYVEVLDPDATPQAWLALDPTNEEAHEGWQAKGLKRQPYAIF